MHDPTLSALYPDAAREVRAVAAPLFDAAAVQRLGGISFLGGLAPEHRDQTAAVPDGSRLAHSVGVAWLAMQTALEWGQVPSSVSVAAAWGLVHDVATWALSHTSEPPFSRRLGVPANALRERMILGDETLPPELRLRKPIEEMGVQPSRLLALFGGAPDRTTTTAWMLRNLVRSPVTPDTLEGIWRAGRTFGVDVPHPLDVLMALRTDVSSLSVKRCHVDVVVSFWTSKDQVYRQHINSSEAVAFESRWSRRILARYRRLDVDAAFATRDDDLHPLKPDASAQLSFAWADAFRYKAPLRYVVHGDYPADRDVPLRELKRLLVKEPITK